MYLAKKENRFNFVNARYLSWGIDITAIGRRNVKLNI